MMSEEEAPSVLYKYRSWSDELQKKSLTHREFFFSSPSKLNDPCEFTTLPDYSRGTKEQVTSFFKTHVNGGLEVKQVAA